MSDSAAEPDPGRDARRSRRGRLLPVWAWLVVFALIGTLLGAVGIRLFAAPGPTSTPLPHSSATATSSGSPGPTPTGESGSTASPDAQDPPSLDLGQGTFSSEMDAFLGDVLNSRNTAVLAQGGTLSDPVNVRAAETWLDEYLSADDAVAEIDAMLTAPDVVWDLALSSDTLAAFRAGWYGAYFPVGAIVARSPDGRVFSFIGDGSTITTVFMAESESQLF